MCTAAATCYGWGFGPELGLGVVWGGDKGGRVEGKEEEEEEE